jgi:Ca2+-binding EF-hand superfamily protein
MKNTITFIALGVLVASGVQAVVPRASADKIDKNKDGKISVTEYVDAMSPGFEKKDKNKDGVLTPDEFPQKNLFRLGDVDKDGKLTREQYQRAYRMQFKRAHDKNGDGYISGDEIK